MEDSRRLFGRSQSEIESGAAGTASGKTQPNTANFSAYTDTVFPDLP